MAKIESSYININRLNAGGKPALGLRSYDGSKINKHRRAYINDGVRNVIVYDELRATFITPDDVIHVGTAGGSLLKPNIEEGGDVGKEGNLYYEISEQGNIQSFSIDAENLQKELPYFLTNPEHDKYDPGGTTDPNSISPNKDTKNDRIYTILARQEFTGAEANITVIQDKEIISESWNPLIVDTEYGEFGVRLWRDGMTDDDEWRNFKVGADGDSEIEVHIHITQQKVITSGSGENNGNSTRSEWMSVTGIEGDSYNGGKWEAGYMKANHLHTTPKNSDIIYRIKKVHFYGPDGKPYTHDLTKHATYIDVYQEANEEKLENVGNATYTFQLTNGSRFDLDSPSAELVEITFDSYLTQQRRYVYTTGESKAAAPLKTYKLCTGGFIGNSGNYASFNEYGDKIASSEYGFDVRVIANTDTSVGRTINLYVDDYNGNRHNITITQPRDTWTTRLSSVTFKNLIVEFEGENINKEGITTIPASGGTVKIYANLNRTYSKISQATGTSMGTTSDTTTADKVEIVTGYKYGNVTAGNEYDYVYITYPNLGSNTTTHNNNYELSSIKWTLGDKSDTYDRGDNGGDYLFNMSQDQNVRIPGSTYSDYTINLTYNETGSTFSDVDKFNISAGGNNDNTGGFHKLRVISTRKRYDTYTSGYRDITGTTVNAPVTINVSVGGVTTGEYLRLNYNESNVSTLSLDGSGTPGAVRDFYFVPGGNRLSSEKVFTVTGKCTNSTSVTDVITFTQAAVSNTLEVSPTLLTFDSGSGSAVVNVKAKTNGSMVNTAPTISENYDWVSYSIDDRAELGDDGINVNISVTSNEKANSSTSERTGTITVKHPSDSNISRSISIRQSGRTVTTPQITSVVFDSSGSYYSMGNIYYKVTINTSAAISAGQVRMKMKYRKGDGTDVWNDLNGYVLADTYGKQISLSAGSNTVSGRIPSVKWPGADYVELYVYYNGQTVGNPAKIYNDLT